MTQIACPQDHSSRAIPSYMLGAYLAVNAIPDAYMVVEGPDCSVMKTQFIQGNHDYLSTLTTVSGHGRISCTMIHPTHLIRRREEPLIDTLVTVADNPEVGGVWIAPMPMAAIIGADYGRLAREAAARSGKDVVALPCKSFSGDWLVGYDEALLSLARSLDLQGDRPSTDRVAIVGHLFDRNEGDQRANVDELKRLLEALGLTVTSIWLSGSKWSELAKVREASTIVALPYGRRAAKWIAKHTGARLVDHGLPLGLNGTAAWLRSIGDATDRREIAEHVIDAELSAVVPHLEWLIANVIQGRRLGFIGDPHMASAIHGLMCEAGARLTFAVATTRKATARLCEQSLDEAVPFLSEPTHRNLAAFLKLHACKPSPDLVITNSFGWPSTCGLPAMEFGFPSYFSHALYDRPFLGFRGALALYDTIGNAIRIAEATTGRDAFNR